MCPVQFERHIEFTIGTDGSPAGQKYTGLHCEFHAEKTITKDTNEFQFRVWNLSADTRAKLAVIPEPVISMTAHYREGGVLSIIADCEKIQHVPEGTDWVTTIQAGEGARVLRRSMSNWSYGSTTHSGTLRGLVADLVRKPKHPKQDIDKIKASAQTKGEATIRQREFAKKYDPAHGFVGLGNSMEILGKLLIPLGAYPSVQDGSLQITVLGVSTEAGEGAVLDQTNGLIGSPTILESGLVAFRCLLNPLVYPGRVVKIQNTRTIRLGNFQVIRAVYEGSTFKDAWYVEAEGIPV